MPPSSSTAAADPGDSHLLRLGIAHDAAFANLLAARLELRFHQDHKLKTIARRVGLHTAQHGRENECSRDEGNIHGDKADRLLPQRWISPNLLRRKVASVGFFQQPDAGIAAQSRIHLSVTGVHCDYFSRATLEKAVGETAGGSANVHAGPAAHVDLPMLQRARQLEPSTTHKRLLVAQDAELGVCFDVGSGLFDLLLIHQHPTCQNERLRALPRGREPALQQQFVEARSHAARLARARRRFDTR